MNINLGLGVTCAIFAMDLVTPALSAEPARDFFVFANVGNADANFRPTINDVIDDSDRSFELGVGYAFNPYLALQGSYQDFGEPTGFAGCPPEVLCIQAFSPEPVQIDGWSASLAATLPVGDAFGVYANLGFIAWDASARSPSLNDSGQDVIYGAGVNWNVSERWGLRLSYEWADIDIDSAKFGALFRF